MFPALYLVALLNILILASLWYLYRTQTRPARKEIRSKDLRDSYNDMQKLMLVITVASIFGIIFTPSLPWVTNSQRQTVGMYQEEVTYGYSQHQFYNIEKSETDLLSGEEIDYTVILLQKEENMFTPDMNYTPSTRTPDNVNTGPIKTVGANGTSAISGIERDRTFNDISMRIFQISLMFWVTLLLGITGLFGINLLRKKETARTGKHLIMVSYLAMFMALVIIILHLIIIYDISILNSYNSDMGIPANQYTWWYNFLPATVAILTLIITVVMAKRSFIKLRYY
jgi:hypothetical protein